MKQHLRAGQKETIKHIDASTGEVLSETEKQHTYMAGSKEQFFLMYATTLSIFYKDLSGPEIKLYAYLLDHYNFGSSIVITRPLKEEIGTVIGLKVGTIDNALNAIVKTGLIYRTAKTMFKLNPRYAFKGSQADRSKQLKFIIEVECPTA